MLEKDIYVVIPCYNEQPRLPKVLSEITRFFPARRVIVVDDGSETPLHLDRQPNCHLLRHSINIGKGLTMKTGADYAFHKGAKAVIFIDADGQHDPREIPKFINYLQAGYDVVFGARNFSTNSPFVRRFGNRAASVYMHILFGIYVSDALSGYRALSQKAYRLIQWSSPRYGVETEMVARLGKYKNSLKIIEFPIETIYKDKYKGVTLIQAVKILGESIWWKLF